MSDVPSDETREEVEEVLRTSVPLGLDSENDLLESLFDVAEDPDTEGPWIREQLAAALAAKRADEASWPERLDTWRLDVVFAELEERAILCVHDAGYTKSDAMEIVDDEWREHGGPESAFTGFCAYTRQDAESALDGGGLFLLFGGFGGDEARTVKIGRKIEHRLTDAGFDVAWDGTAGTRIHVTAIDMRRRGLQLDDDADVDDADVDDAELPCPACGEPLTTRNRSPDAWLFCDRGGGVALRDAALREKLGDHLVDRVWERLEISSRRSERRCPQCRAAMAPLSIGDPAERVEVDVCGTCRIIWFDPVELARVERVHQRSDEKTILLFLDWFGELHRTSRITVEAPPEHPDA